MRYFTIFNRIALAAGFLPSGLVKIMGERFTDLSVNHPMGNYLEALHHTGYYYTVIGIMQVAAAILLLIPRTALLGAMLYFPIIVNICILSLAVRFEGSLLSSPLMVLANIYLLFWDYDRIKLLFIQRSPVMGKQVSNKFPVKFFAGGFALVVAIIVVLTNSFAIMPRNTLQDCAGQCDTNKDPRACLAFCNCIHKEGKHLEQCLEQYKKAVKK